MRRTGIDSNSRGYQANLDLSKLMDSGVGFFNSQMRTYLLSEILGQRFAFDVEGVREAVRMPWVTPVAETPADVCGVVNYRGQCIAVVDPALRLIGRTSERGLDSYLVIWSSAEDEVALVVDRVESLIEGCPKPAPKDAASPPFVLGHLDDERGLVTVLDVPQLLRPEVRDFATRARGSEAPTP
jgi:chemotaxis signal transduction protein